MTHALEAMLLHPSALGLVVFHYCSCCMPQSQLVLHVATYLSDDCNDSKWVHSPWMEWALFCWNLSVVVDAKISSVIEWPWCKLTENKVQIRPKLINKWQVS